jgi:hypothetical protein
MVQVRTDEPTLPSATQIQAFLNAGMIEVAAEIGPTTANEQVACTPGVFTITLPVDVMEITSASYSTDLPTNAGVIVYPLTQMDQRRFFDFTGGLPTVGFGPPLAYTILTDSGGTMTFQLYPAPSGGAGPNNGGYVNLYYRQRPIPYADTATSTTNIDPIAQEPMILWACIEVLRARGRVEDIPPFEKRYADTLARAKEYTRRRTSPPSGSVRDVYAMPSPASPYWW